jgi:hypothetical protein
MFKLAPAPFYCLRMLSAISYRLSAAALRAAIGRGDLSAGALAKAEAATLNAES